MSRTDEQITRDILVLRENLRIKFGVHHDDELIAEVLQSKIRKAARIDIESALMSYDPEEAADAVEILQELRVKELEQMGGMHRGQPLDYWDGQ